MSEQTISTKESAGEDIEWHSVVVRGDDGRVYKVRDKATSERGVNALPARAGEEVYVVWGVVHDVKLTGPVQITPAGKGILIQNMVMRILVERGYYTDPETWDELSPDVQDAWKVIGAAWLPDPPAE